MRKKSREKPMALKLLGWSAYVLFLGIALAGGSVAGWIGQSAVASELVKQKLRPIPPQEVFGGRQAMTFLILGCDEELYYAPPGQRATQVLKNKARADMILVAKLDFEQNRITGLSIPRDTECALPGYRRNKINWYHANAPQGLEAELTRQAVEYLLPGVKIDRVVTLDYDAFQRMVDLVGGVEVDVPKRMKYRDVRGGIDLDLHPGPQTLDGYTAMCYVRYRKGDSDFHRQERQKDFMVSLKQAALAKPLQLPSIMEESRALLDNAFTPREIAGLTFFAQRVPAENIKMGMVPVREGRGTNLLVDESRLFETLAEFDLLRSGSARLSYSK
jgi:polyisoprenyl-teichoic acid--peptidoglycan teichoic acid transferase